MNLTNERKLVKKWQKLFKLQNWDIKVELHKEYEDDELIGNSGYVKLDVADLTARIVVNENSPDKVEDILMHEMLHILLREVTVTLNALFRTQDAEDVFFLIDELLVRRLESAFTALMEVKNEEANASGTLGFA